jgi:SpoVK/Ycf46/Vps4 family AAA+-type ATPase
MTIRLSQGGAAAGAGAVGAQAAGRDLNVTFLREDFVGSRDVKHLDAIVAKIDNLVGLGKVKEQFFQDMKLVVRNLIDEDQDKVPQDTVYHRLFLGRPGTGKTTVAELYAELLALLGVVAKAEVVMKRPEDFKGSVLGESEKKVNEILDAAIDKVLFIDEAYGLHSNEGDIYSKAIIDALVGRFSGTSKDRTVLLMAGYKDKMEEMLREANPGLSSRFQTRIEFEDYDDQELSWIARDVAARSKKTFTRDALFEVVRLVGHKRCQLNFGNAREVVSIVKAIEKSSLTTGGLNQTPSPIITLDIVSPPEAQQAVSLKRATLQNRLQTYPELLVWQKNLQKKLDRAKQRGMPLSAEDLNLALNMLFLGNPGTGKSTGAAAIGEVLKSLDLLPTADVVIKSVSELQTGYVGQAGLTVRKVFDDALGKVLLIDEAYRLADSMGPGESWGTYNKEILDELVNCLEEQKYKGKMCVIMAGYEGPVKAMLTKNQGLSSRFPTVVRMKDFDPELCLKVARAHAEEKGYRQAMDSVDDETWLRVFKDLTDRVVGWANGRDVKTFVEKCDDYCEDGDAWTDAEIQAVADQFLADRGERPSGAGVEPHMGDGSPPVVTGAFIQDPVTGAYQAAASYTPPPPAFAGAGPPMGPTTVRTATSTAKATAPPAVATKYNTKVESKVEELPDNQDMSPEAFGVLLEEASKDLGISDIGDQVQKGELSKNLMDWLKQRKNLSSGEIQNQLGFLRLYLEQRRKEVQKEAKRKGLRKVRFCTACGRIFCNFAPIEFNVEVNL